MEQTKHQGKEFEKPEICDVLSREGIELKPRGRDLWARCPFHQDKTPSFKVNMQLQKFYCFSCHRHGDVIDLMMILHGTNFEGSLKRLGMRGVKPPDSEARRVDGLVKKFRAWCTRYYDQLAEEHRAYHKLTGRLRDEAQVELCAWIFHELPVIEHRLKILYDGTDEEKFNLWKEVTGGRF